MRFGDKDFLALVRSTSGSLLTGNEIFHGYMRLQKKDKKRMKAKVQHALSGISAPFDEGMSMLRVELHCIAETEWIGGKKVNPAIILMAFFDKAN